MQALKKKELLMGGAGGGGVLDPKIIPAWTLVLSWESFSLSSAQFGIFYKGVGRGATFYTV